MNDPLKDEWNRLVQQSRKAPAQPPTEPPPEPPGSPRKWGLPVLFALSLAALGLYFQGTLDPAPAKPSLADIRAGHEASLILVSKAIHDYALFHGRYPRNISDVIPITVNIDYRLTQDGFELRMVDDDGTPLVVRGK
jgi:hypothetical protein